AIVVILAGTIQTPEIVLRHEVDLADPWVRESMPPYHQELGDRRSEGKPARQRGCAAARTASSRALRRLVSEMRRHGLEPSRATVVASSLADPARAGGPPAAPSSPADPRAAGGRRARAHAEGPRLYREAAEAALRGCGLHVVTIGE